MQTFLPNTNYVITAETLDYRRLGKQRVETFQNLKANLQGPRVAFRRHNLDRPRVELLWFAPLKSGDGIAMTPWYNHPAVKMWRGYEYSLCQYGFACCNEWVNRGYEDNMWNQIYEMYFKVIRKKKFNQQAPAWLDRDKFHSAHRAALLYKGWLDLTWQQSPIKLTDSWLKANGFPIKHDFETVTELKQLHIRLDISPKLKDTHYAQFKWQEKPEINYYWPV